MTKLNLDVMEVLKNGVKVFDLTDIIDEDFQEAQNILDTGNYNTSSIYAENAYNSRVSNDFVGVYKLEIDSISEYNRFIDMLVDTHSMSYVPTFQDWKMNMVTIEGRQQRLGKWMKKESVDQTIIDFYSQQVRTGKEVYYVTISDLPQHIAGMTYYRASKVSGSLLTSCQHPDSEQSVSLGGSLHDDRLLVAMLHKDIEDLEDMEGCLLARVIMRIIDLPEAQILIPSRYYGSVNTKEILDRCLVQLEEKHIFSKDIRWNDNEDDFSDRLNLDQRTNGHYEMYVCETVYIEEEVEEEVEIECPLCEGTKHYTVSLGDYDKEVEIDCPMCNGYGTYDVSVYLEIDEHVEVETEVEIQTYTDDYEHNGYQMRIRVNKTKLEAHLEAYKD